MTLKLCYSLFIACFFANVGCHRKQVPSFNLDLSKMSLSKNQDTCNGTNLPFSVTVKVDTIQHVSDNGILFSILIRNTTDSQIFLSPPTKNISIRLLDKSGKNLLYPYIPKELIFAQDAYVNLSYSVTKITVNGHNINVDPYSDQKLRLPQKGEMITAYKLDKILPQDASQPTDKPQLTKLPPGDYILFLNSVLDHSSVCIKTLSFKRSIKYQNQQ